MIDPIALAERLQELIGSAEKRKYYRFRPAPYYGGIATADCVGCCLRCLFCWSWHIINPPLPASSRKKTLKGGEGGLSPFPQGNDKGDQKDKNQIHISHEIEDLFESGFFNFCPHR